MVLWYSDIFGRLLESLHQMLEMTCSTYPRSVTCNIVHGGLSIAHPGWLNLLQFEWFRVSQKKNGWTLGALHQASHRSTDFVLCSRHFVRLKTMPPSWRGASFASSSCTGTCNAVRLSQQILPSWDGRKDRRCCHNSEHLSTLLPCSLKLIQQTSLVFLRVKALWFHWQPILILCFKYRYPGCPHRECTRQQACWEGEKPTYKSLQFLCSFVWC